MNEKIIYQTLRKIDNGSDLILKIIFILILLIGAYISYDMWYIYYQSGKDVVGAYKPEVINEDSLKKISENVVAWITIDDTNIDYPILQGKDNTEYLNKNPFGEYSLSGSIFLDSRNKPDFSDPYNIVYGHHMSGGFMFGALDYFKKKDYFYKHRKGTLTVGNDKYNVHVIGILITDAKVKAVFSPEPTKEEERLKEFKNQSKYWDDNKERTLISLTTCKEPLTTARTALVCRIIPQK